MPSAIVIGAGPAGSYAALLLAREGYDVKLIEEHKEIGIPMQCTGIVTPSILKRRIDIGPAATNRLKTTTLEYRGRTISITFDQPDIILDRAAFDRLLAERAEKEGVELILGTKALSAKPDGEVRTASGSHRADLVIGADGPRSIVAARLNPGRKMKCWSGYQVRVKGTFAQTIRFFPMSGAYGWVVPESRSTARMGMATAGPVAARAESFFSSIMEDWKDSTIDRQGGLIPLYDRRLKTKGGKLRLLGDAAGMVKATTGGGIVPGMKAAECLVEGKPWRHTVGRELTVHLLMRRIMDRFSSDEWIRLFGLASGRKVKGLLSRIDRDHASRMLLPLLMSEPRFLLMLKPHIFI